MNERNIKNNSKYAKKIRLRKMVASFLSLSLVIVSVYVYSKYAHAAITKEISYQGKLTNSSGVAVADGSYNMVISLYTVASGGTPVWTARGTVGSPTTRAVTVTNGIFSIMIGDTVAGDNAINLDFNSTYYLGIKVGSDSEMSPRKKVGASGYAFNSDLLDGLDSATSGANAHIVTTDTSGNLTVSGDVNVNGGDINSTTTLTLNPTGNLNFQSSSYYVNESGQMVLNTDETINGIDINAGAIGDVTTFSSTYLATGASYVDIIGSAELRMGGTSVLTSARALQNITAATVDNLYLNGTTIGHTSDTDLLNLASNMLTVNGTLDLNGPIDLDVSVNDYAANFYNSNTGAAAGGLFIRSDGTGNLLTLNASGTDVMTISSTQASFNVPTSFTASGDVSMAYDLIFTNQTASNIKTNAPFTIEVGELFESNDLTLRTFNNGDVVLDAAGGVTLMQPQPWMLANGTSALNFQNASGTSILNIDSTNNRVGIGTTSPATRFHISDTSYTFSASGLSFGDGDTGFYESADDTLQVYVAGFNRLNFTSNGIYPSANDTRDLGSDSLRWRDIFSVDGFFSGNVGIGTTSPAEILDVNGRLRLAQTTAPATTTDKLYNVSGALYWNGVNLSGGGALPSGTSGQTLRHNGTSWIANSVLYNNGTNVGIGTTSPAYKFDVEGTIQAQVDNTYAFRIFENSGDNFRGGLGLENNGDAYLNITSDSGVATKISTNGNSYFMGGNFGIGTSNPGAMLAVSKTYSTAVASEQYGAFINTAFGIADTGLKQGLRLNTGSNITSGTVSSVTGVLSLIGNNGSGGTTDYAHALWTRVDSGAGHVTNNAYGLMVNDGSGAGTIGTQYGVYVFDLVKGSTNNFAIYTAGSTKSYFGGNVGIGTTSPARTLDVNGAIRIGGQIYSPGTYAGFFSDGGSALPVKVGSLAITSDYGNSAPTNGLYVQGNVGIGTTSPGKKLDVNGDVILSGLARSLQIGDGSGANLYFNNTSNNIIYGSNQFQFNTNQTQGFTFNGGNVGIGTTNPIAVLEVNKSDSSTSLWGRGEELIIRNSNGTNNTWSGIGFRGTSSGSIAAGISAVYYDTTNAYARLQFGTRGAAGWDSDVLVLNNGLVGINTTSPAEALDVNGRLRLAQTTAPGTVTDKMYNVSGNLYWNGVNLTGGGALPSGTSGQTLRNNGSGWVANSLLYNDGTNIGIGTTNPSKRFQVTDTYNIYIAGSGLGTGANIYSDNTMYLGTSTANSINLETADTTRLTVGSAGDFNFNSGQVFLQQSTGNLGIGTTNPANFKLQIAGNLGPDADNTYNLGSGTYRWANVYATNIAGAITPTGFTQGSVVFAGTGGLLTQNNGSFFWDNLNGRLGIGTSSPSSSLEVANGNITFGANDITSVGNIYAYSNQGSASNANFSFNNDANTGMFSSGDDTLNFSTAGTERLRISASGSVGIGTTNPEGLLNIVGDNTNLGLKVGSTYIDLPTGQRLSNSMIADDLLFYLPMQNSLSSSRGNTDYYTRTDTSSGSSATYTADSGYITHDYVYNNTPRFEKTNIGKGVWVENGRRNLFQYASFEDGGSINGWTNSGLETFTTTTGYKKHQSYSATLGDTNATGGNAYRSHTLTSGQSYPFYCYALNTTSGVVRSAVDSSVVELYANGAIATSYKPVEGGWYKISGTVTGTGGAVNYGVSVKASKQIQLDGCQIEADYNSTNGVPYETSLIYNNGTNQRNRGEETLYYYAWRGTGNTESSDFLIDPARGTASFWWRPEWPYDRPTTDLYLMQVPNVIQIFYSAADDKVYAQMYNGSNWTTVSVSSAAQTFVGGTDHYVSVRWDATSGLILNFDGIEYAAAATSWTAQTQQMTTSTVLYVGSKSSAGGRADSLISDFAIFGRSLTKAEVLQIYNDKAPIEDYQRSDLVMLQQSNRTFQRGNIRVTGELYGGSVNTGTLSTSYISSGNIGLNNSSNFSSHIVLHLPFEGTIDGSRKEVGTFQRTDASSGSAVALDENSLKYVSKNANEPRIDRGFDSNNYNYDTGTKTGNFGVYMEESRKNILLNSSFESTPSEWNASSGCSVSQSTGKSLHGTYSGNMTSTAACRVFQTVDLSGVTAGTKHQVSAYVWRNESNAWGADISTSIASLYARTDDGLTALSTTYTPLGGGWYRLTGEFDSTAANNWDVGVYLPSASRNIYVDGIQVERSVANGSVYFPTTYIPTTASEITRAGERLSYSVPASYKSEKGGFSFWFKPQWTRAITSDNTDKYLLYIPNELRVRLDATNDRFSIDHWNGSAWVTTSTTSTTDVTRYGWNHLSCGWYWNYNRCYLNGNSYASSASWTPQDPTGKTLYIGSDENGAYQANAQIAGLAIFDAYLTPEQQTQLYYNRGEFEDYYRTDITRLVDSTSNAIQNGSLYLNGTVGMGSGTAALPSLTFTGDKNTGIYNPIADTLGLSTGGTERLRIDANGNVGIGTTSPNYKLDLAGVLNITNGYSEPTSEIGYRLKFADNGGITNDSGMGLSGALGNESLWINKGSANGSIRFMFGTLGEKVTFTSSGNVGIGTTSPNHLLTVNGGIGGTVSNVTKYFESARNVTPWDQTFEENITGWSSVNNTSLTQSVAQAYEGSSSFRIKRNDMTGGGGATFTLGTSLKAGRTYTLSGYYKTVNGTSNANIKLNFDATNCYTNGTAYVDKTLSAASDWTFFSVSLTAVTVSSNNNYIWLANSLPDTTQEIYFDNLVFSEGSLPFTEYANMRTTIDGTKTYFGGNVGIGTTNLEHTLEVNGSIGLVYSSTNANFLEQKIGSWYGKITPFNNGGDMVLEVNYAGNEGDIIFKTNGAENLRIKEGGNVGIGTAAPAANLDIQNASGAGARMLKLSNSGGGEKITMLTNSNSQGFQIFENYWSNQTNLQVRPATIGIDNGWINAINIDHASGNVGIGTTSPDNKLSIAGVDDKDNGPILSLYGNAVNQFESGRVRFTEADGYYQGGFVHYDGSNNRFIIGVHENSDLLTSSDINAITILRGSGNVGIGTPTPAEILDVNGRMRLAQTTAPATTTDKLYNVSGALYWNGVNLSGGGALPSGTSGQTMRHNGTSWVANSLLYNNGTNIGIGTTNPTYPLHIYRTGANSTLAIQTTETPGTSNEAQFDLKSGDDYTRFFSRDSDNNFGIYHCIGGSCVTKLRLNGSGNMSLMEDGGNVGIGTTSPGVRLDVVGGAIRTDNQLISTIATGTAPLAVSSTTLVSNLNADLWDGNQFASYLNQAVLTTSSPTFSRVYTTGRSSSWGSTNGIDTGGMNVTMGTGSSATWLISGTSGGTFRAGIQSLDADGTLRIYSNSSFISINGSTISNATWGGNAIADGYVADTITISGGTIGSNNISGTLTTTGALTIGDGGDTIAVNSSSWDVSTAGAFSGVTTIEMSGQLTSTLATGTAPFAVTSTTVNTNLNADMLDGLHSSSFLTANQTITLSGDASGSGTTSISVTNNLLNREDNRAINPAELGAGKMRFGFTSWANNSSSPYADFIHMRSYTDGSGGSDNLLMFNKSTIAMRLWQQAYGSATDYANYRDVVMTDQNSANVTLAGTLTMNGAGVLGDGGDDIAINSNDWDISSAGAISGITTLNMSGQLTSTLATGTAPLAVTSTTLNTNLNADLLDGQHGSYYATASSISGTDNYIPRFNGTSALENSNIYDNGTNIGIGTTSPGEKLDLNNGILKISRASATDNDSPGITNTSDDDFTYNGLYLNHYGFGFHRPTPYAGSESGAYVSGYYGINMFTSGLNRLVIEQDGNVGIGTSDPGYLFDVNGNTNINGNLIISGTVDGYDVSAYGTYFIGSAGTSGQVWTSDGTGAGYWAAAGSGMPSGTEGQMLYNNAGTWTAFSAMYWDDTNSRLGIGTTTPGASLDIFGTTNGLRLSYNSSNYANLSTGSTGILTMTSSDTSQSSITLGAGTATDQLVLFDGNTRDFYVGQDDTDDFFKIGSGAAVGSNTYLTINGSGNVGIGVTSPATYKFYVDWNSDGTSPAYVNNSNAWTNGSADYAEFFKTKDHDLAPGEAVCVDTNNSNAVKRCTRAEDPDLMGIVSTSPSVLGNAQPGREFDNNYVIVGMLGQVPAKVSTENGQINPGDSLTAATKPGYVMKANSGDSTVGVALEPIQQGEGIIQVLISRRNKSLTVEKVEEEVSQRIAEMDVEDQVNRIITEAQAQLTQSIASQSTIVADLSSQLNAQVNRITTLESQMELINAQNQAILDFAIALDVQKMIYKDEIGNVDLLDGKITAAEMVAGVFTVKITDPEAKTIGEAVIRANNSNVEIKTKAVTDNSKIFVTAKVAAEYPLAVTQKKPSEGFVVSVKGNVTEDISFDWWIVESKDETEAVPTVKTQTTESFNGPVDSDGDGLVDEEENRLGTNPYSYDTDGDTFLDGDELRYGYNPLEASDGNKGDKISFSNPKFSGEINDNFIIINAAFIENELAGDTLSAAGTVLNNRSVTIFVYGSDGQISTAGTIADNNGNWEISLSKDFAGGQYEVYVCQTNTDGTITAKSAAFILAK